MMVQLKRRFRCTLGCAELEEIAQHVLLDLCELDLWDAWLDRGKYEIFSHGHVFWNHSHWVGVDSKLCSFDRYVEYHTTVRNRFRVNHKFIEAMMFEGKG